MPGLRAGLRQMADTTPLVCLHSQEHHRSIRPRPGPGCAGSFSA